MTISTIYTNQVNYKSGTQFRVDTSMNHVERLAERILELQEEGQKIDPIKVMLAVDIESLAPTYYLIDGFHRFFAQKEKLGFTEVEVEIIGKGTKREATVLALRANAEHQLVLARSKGDVQNACKAAAELLKAEQLEAGVDEFQIKVTAADIEAMVGLKEGNRTAKAAASAINKEAKTARDELIVSMLERGKTQTEIASAAGCDKATVSRFVAKVQGAQMQQSEAPISLPQEDPYIDCPFSDDFDTNAELNNMLNGNQSAVDEINSTLKPTTERRERVMEYDLNATQAFNVAAKAFGVFERHDIPQDEVVEALKSFPEKRLKEILKHFSEFAEILSAASLLERTSVSLKADVMQDMGTTTTAYVH